MPDVNAFLKFYDVQSPKRAFYASGQKDDYLGYVDTGIKSNEELDYLDYAGNEAKSSGLFNAEGKLDRLDKKRLREQLRQTQSCIWDLVISFTEDYGEKYMQNVDYAQALLKKVLPKFFKNTGLYAENMIWYAGLHTNTDNRHIHISFFEKEPIWLHQKSGVYCFRQKGKFKQDAIDRLKIDIQTHFLEPIEGVKRVRQMLVNEAKSVVNVNHSIVIKKLIRKFYKEIPTEGETAYKSENMDGCRGTIDEIVTHILKNGENREEYYKLSGEIAKRDSRIEEMCLEQGETAKPYLYGEKFRADLYRRMGNAIIKEVLKKRREELIRASKERHAKAKQRERQKGLLDCVAQSAQIAAFADEEAIRCFEEYRAKIERFEIEWKISEMEM